MDKKEIVKRLEKKTNEIAIDLMKKCKSGETYPEQEFELEQLQGKIADLLIDIRDQNIIQEGYFSGNWTRKNLILLAEHDNFTMNREFEEILDTRLDTEKLKDEIMEKGNVGSSEVRKLYENKHWFIYISIDRHIEVINYIYKKDFSKSKFDEL